MSQVPIPGTEPDSTGLAPTPEDAPIPSGVIPIPGEEPPILGPEIPTIPEDLQRFFDLPETLRTAGEAKAGQVQTIAGRLKTLGETLPEEVGALAAAPTRPGFTPTDLNAAGGLLAAAFGPRGSATRDEKIGELVFGETEEFRQREDAINNIVEEITKLNGDLYWTNWESNIVNALPIFVRADPNLTVDSLLEATQSEIREAPAGTRAFIAQAIEAIQVAQEAERREAEEVVSLLERPGGSLRAFHAINPAEVSAKTLVEDLVAAGRFSLPEGMTNEEFRSALISGGMSAREADEQIFDAVAQAFQISLELKEWDEANRRLMEEGNKIRSGEIISAVRRAQWVRAASQPLIAILAPTTWWLNNVSKPLTGVALGVGRGLEVVATNLGVQGSDVGTFAKWGQHFDKAREEELSIWESLAYTTEEWDTNGGIKFLYEIVFDPLSYLGFGIATKITRPIPYIGRGVGAFERGFVTAAEYPFKVAKAAFLKNAPRTLAFTGQRQANGVLSLLKVQFEANANIPIQKAEAHELRGLATAAIDAALDDPNGLGNLNKLGRGLLGWEGIGPEDTARLVKELGISMDDFVERGVMLQLNEAMELTAGHGIAKFLMVDEAAAHITRRVFGLQGTREQMQIVKRFLRTRRTQLKTRALAAFDAPAPRDQVFNMMSNVRNSWIKANQQLIQVKRYQQGIVASSLNALDNATRMVLIDGIDKYVTQRAARAYLVFGFYGIANIAEVAIKTMLATNSLRQAFWRGSPGQRIAFAFHKLERTPAQILFDQPFNLGLQLPEREMTVLATATSSRLEKSVARRKLRQWTVAYNKSRSLRGIGESIGATAQDITGYNFGNRITSAGRANYYDKMWRNQVRDRAPEQVQAVSDAVARETSGLEAVMEKKVAEGYRDAMTLAVMAGDEQLLRNVVKTFTPGTVRRGEAEQMLAKHVEFPSDIIDVALNRVESGELWRAGGMDNFASAARERIYEHHFTSPEAFEEHFGKILREFVDVPATSQADLNAKAAVIDEAIETFQDTISNTLRAAISYSDNLRNVEESSVFFNELWTTRINPVVERSSQSMDEAVGKLREQFGTAQFADSFTNVGQQDAFRGLMDSYFNRIAAYRTARSEYSAIRDSFFQEGSANFRAPGQRDNAWWSEFRAAVRKPWDEAEDKLISLHQDSQVAKMRITRQTISQPVDVSRDTLSRQHVAALYGLNPGDLERSMYLTDIMAVWPKKNFIGKTLNRVNQATSQQGKTAEDLGWSEGSIGRVYDSMVQKLRANPSVETGVEPQMVQLQSMVQELTSLGYRRKALISDNAEVALNESIDRLSTRAFGRGERVTRILKESDAFDVSLAEGPPALPGAEVTIGEQNIAMREFREAVTNEATQLQQDVITLQGTVSAMQRRNALPISRRLGQLREKGLDIQRADLELENFIELNRTAGTSQAAQVEKTAQWQRVVDEIDNLNVDVNATVSEATREFGKSFVSGSPGATADVSRQASIQSANAELQAARRAQTNARARVRTTSAEDIPQLNIQLDEATVRVERATQALSEARTTTVARLQSGRRQARARAMLEERTLKEVRQPGGPELTFTRKQVPEFAFQSETGLIDENVRFWNTPEGRTIRQDALDETNLRYGQDFPDYDNPTAFTNIMKMIFPFWQYEAHRWAFWLPREFARHPGVWAGWGKYQDNTDGGYFDIPGIPLDINPLRGTIFMGGMRRLAMRDFPEYYDNFEGFAETFDQLSRWGFYPGFPIGVSMATFGAQSGQMQLGELLPPTARTVQSAISAMSPKLGNLLNEIFFSDRFRDFMQALEVDRLNFGNPDGVFGSDILAKKILNQELLPEEQEVWLRATRGIGKWTMLFEQTGLFKFSPEERREIWSLTNQIISEHRGIPVEQLEDMRRAGIQYEDVFGPNPPEVDQAIRAMDSWRRFSGASISLLPSQEGQARAHIRQFWATATDEIEGEREKLLTVQQEFERNPSPGTMSNWEFALKEKVLASISIIENLKQSEIYEDVPVTIAERRKAAEETGIKIFFNQFEELRELYFQRELKDVWDVDQQRFVPDFDGFYLYRELLVAALSDEDQGRFEEFLHENDTPLESLRHKVSKDFLRPYNNLSRIILTEFNQQERSIIRAGLTAGAANQERIRLRREEGVSGELIIADYEGRLRTARKNLREVDPQLDAWLAYFGETRNVNTPQAQRLLDSMVETTRISGVEALASQ